MGDRARIVCDLLPIKLALIYLLSPGTLLFRLSRWWWCWSCRQHQHRGRYCSSTSSFSLVGTVGGMKWMRCARYKTIQLNWNDEGYKCRPISLSTRALFCHCRRWLNVMEYLTIMIIGLQLLNSEWVHFNYGSWYSICQRYFRTPTLLRMGSFFAHVRARYHWSRSYLTDVELRLTAALYQQSKWLRRLKLKQKLSC